MLLVNPADTKHKPDMDERYHQLNRSNIARVLYWRSFFHMMENVPGDIVECGVGRGRSLLIIAALNSLLQENEGGQRRLYGYDSFEGFPEPSEEDRSPRNPRKGEWSTSPSGVYRYSEEFTKTVLASADLDNLPYDLHVTKGYFQDTLPRHPDRPIALLHLDGDLYQSYKACLNELFPKLAPGGIVVFDDFYHGVEQDEPFPGARLAVREYLGDRFTELEVSMLGNYYLRV